MVLLQPKLSLRVSQKQILTPGLVQMVSVLALNKLELTDMINAELTENPVLEELENSVPLLDEVSAREEKETRQLRREREEQPQPRRRKGPLRRNRFWLVSSGSISIPDFAAPSRWRTAKSPPSRISSPSPAP